MAKRLQIMLVAGARPNFMKVAPLIEAFKKINKFEVTLVHTGQHYDDKMSDIFFKNLGIRKPDINLGVGGGSHGEQTGQILIKFDEILAKNTPDLVVVVGDVNSTVACALAAKKRGIRVAHVEAGLRSFDESMPEEINRVLTDRLSDFLFCTEPDALKNLKAEGITKNVFLVGNVMIDTLLKQKAAAEKSDILSKLGIAGKKYGLATLHRPSNVDDPKILKRLIELLKKIARTKLPIVFPIHPRTKKNLANWKISTFGLIISEPLGYWDFLKLETHAAVVLTDSGGIQEETTILGVPCLTLRENTERPVTVTDGTNKIVGTDSKKILATLSVILKKGFKAKKTPKFWDGKAASRIAKILWSRHPELVSGSKGLTRNQILK